MVLILAIASQVPLFLGAVRRGAEIRRGGQGGGQDTTRDFGGGIPGGCPSWAWHEAKMRLQGLCHNIGASHPIESLDSAERAVSRGQDLELRAVRMVVSVSSSSLDTFWAPMDRYPYSLAR